MRTLIAMFTAALLTAACSSGGSATDSATQASTGGGEAGSVLVVDFAFEPQTVEVGTGEEVTWTVEEGATAHTVKFDDEESEELAAGDTYSRSFDEAGEYDYVCGIHPQMTGTVTVE